MGRSWGYGHAGSGRSGGMGGGGLRGLGGRSGHGSLLGDVRSVLAGGRRMIVMVMAADATLDCGSAGRVNCFVCFALCGLVCVLGRQTSERALTAFCGIRCGDDVNGTCCRMQQGQQRRTFCKARARPATVGSTGENKMARGDRAETARRVLEPRTATSCCLGERVDWMCRGAGLRVWRVATYPSAFSRSFQIEFSTVPALAILSEFLRN